MLISVKRNIFANYVGSAYSTLIGVVMLPIYIEFMGAEAFGLVGFFTLLMSWLSLLTAGISPTVARQVAYYEGLGTIWGQQFREMLRSIELIILGFSVATVLLVIFLSEWLAKHWLTVIDIPITQVIYCISLMGLIISIRWFTMLYTSCLSGMERQIWISGFNAFFATIRFVVVYALLRWVTNNPTHYFEFQLVVSMLELAVVAWFFYIKQPKSLRHLDPGFSFSISEIRKIAPFAVGVTYTSLLWIFMTQSDKLILSHVLTLAEYGYFAIIVIISNGILLFSGPINQAVLPRMTKFFSEGNQSAMLALYRKSTQFTAVVALSISGVIALFSDSVVFILTGSEPASSWGAPVLTWFALGNSILIIVGMQYLLQYVHGQVKMHVINTTINAFLQVPILVLVAINFGAIEVAKAWFAIRLVTFFIWPPLVHQKFAPGLHIKWLMIDVLLPLIGALFGLIVINIIASSYLESQESRLVMLFVLCGIWLFVLLISALMANEVRNEMISKVRCFKNELVRF